MQPRTGQVWRTCSTYMHSSSTFLAAILLLSTWSTWSYAALLAHSGAQAQLSLHQPAKQERGWKWAEHFAVPEGQSTRAEHLQALQQAQAAAALPGQEDELATDQNDQWSSPAVVDDNWHRFNESQLTPFVPQEIAWLLEEAQDRLRNRSNLPLQLEMARTLARYTSIVYCEIPNIHAWNCSRCNGRAREFETFSTIEDVAWDLKAYTGWSPSLQGVVVAFRGTDSHSLGNWVENMRYWRTDFKLPYPGADGSKIHTGFFQSYNSSNLQPNVTAAVSAMLQAHPGAHVYVIGHSMGAAVATICAIDVRHSFNLTRDQIHLYTFGSPRVGNDIFAAFVRTQIRDSIRVTHNRDIVPTWPPMWVGFHHVATEIWVIDIGFAHVVGICDDSGEDPMCHNSVCFLGFCTSIADHLLYLGEIMGRGYPNC